eukprot:TRINITY_DN6080_c0_g1_i1.p2 TRINITY_DN6080_c0_g1~~TRINITY_DN6080_c0_g1_i1.p2  ORF type:complete len:193 (+),score=48.62 TRINITY_DN6080_c0_g1_i1:73-651(+)
MARFRALLLVPLAATLLGVHHGPAWVFATDGRSAPPCQLHSRRAVRVARAGGNTAKSGIFSPLVEGVKAAMGAEELNKLRAEFIKAHTKVITQFVDTSESKFGRIALRKLFEAADADSSGQLDKEEVRACLKSLGFTWMDNDKQVDGVMTKADLDGNEEIDFEEFAKTAPTTLRQNLVKLAKKNGNDLGFLV